MDGLQDRDEDQCPGVQGEGGHGQEALLGFQGERQERKHSTREGFIKSLKTN